MANKNPIQARRAKLRKRLEEITVPDVNSIQSALWIGMTELLEIIEGNPDCNDLCKLVNSLSRATSEYRCLLAYKDECNRRHAPGKPVNIFDQMNLEMQNGKS